MRIIIHLDDEFIANKTEVKLNKQDNIIDGIKRVIEFSAYTKLADYAKEKDTQDVVVEANDKTDSDISSFVVAIASKLHE